MNEELRKAKDNRLTVKLQDGKLLIVGDVLGKLTKWIDDMAIVGDIMVQFDPVHAALPWGAFRFVLKALVSYREAASAVWEGIEKICADLVWVYLQEMLYLNGTSHAEPQLRRAIIAFHVLLFTALAKYLGHLNTSKTVLLLSSPFRSKMTLQQYSQDIEQGKTLIESFSRQVDRESQLEQSAKIKLIQDCLNSLKTPVDRLQVLNERMYSQLEEKARHETLAWISEIPHANHFSRAFSKVLDGTGKWLLESTEFEKWKSSSTAEILRVHGKAGSGKSTLLSIVLNQLLCDCESGNSPPPVYFYCARTSEEPDRSQPLKILRCLLKQLAEIPGSDKVQQSVVERYGKRSTRGELQEGELSELSLICIESRGPTYILVDALDESDPMTRDVLLGGLVRLLRDSKQLVKILVTSRDQRYENSILDYPELVVSPQKNAADIETFINFELDRMQRQKLILSGNLSPKLRDDIKGRLVEKANGMFRWAALQLQALKFPRDEVSLREHLRQSSDDLKQSYQMLFDFEINHLKRYLPGKQDIAIRAFQWLMVAKIQLSSDEFRSIVGHVDAKSSPMPVEDLLQYCFGLVEHDETADAFRFCHLSVREFFESNNFLRSYSDFEEPRLHAIAAVGCLNHIFAKWEQKNVCPPYATIYWAHHASRAAERRASGVLKVNLERFLNSSSRSFASWKNSLVSALGYSKWDIREGLCCDDDNINEDNLVNQGWGLRLDLLCPLLVTVMWNLCELTPLVCTDQDVEKFNRIIPGLCDGGRGGLLECAAERGHVRMLTTLLDLGMSLEKTESGIGQVLMLACRNGHVQMVEFLLQHSGQTYQGEHLNKALLANMDGTRDPVVTRLLLSHGADANSRNGRGLTALSKALLDRDAETVSLLLDHRANVDMKNDQGMDAFCIACGEGDAELVKMIANRGANFNVRDNQGRTALMIAAASRNGDEVCNYLLDVSLDAGSVDTKGWDALHHAIAGRNFSAMRLLLNHRQKKGANTRVEWRSSLLNVAVSAGRGCVEMLGILKVYGLYDEDFKFDLIAFDTGLQNVISYGSVEDTDFFIRHGAMARSSTRIGNLVREAPGKIKLLLQAGFVPSTDMRAQWFEVVCMHEDMELARELVLYSSDASETSDKPWFATLLPEASGAGHLAAVEMLLDLGAGIDSIGKSGHTALDCATMSGNIPVMELLLARGADVHGRVSFLLVAAVCTRQILPVKLILDKMEDSTGSLASDGHAVFRDALMAAAEMAHVETVELILAKCASCGVAIEGMWDDALVEAVTRNGIEMASFLLRKGASVDAVTKHNRMGYLTSPLIEAASAGNIRMIELLLQHGADVHLTVHGLHCSCLAAAIDSGDIDAVNLLVDAGANADAELCQRSLTKAAARNETDIMELILQMGADVNAIGDSHGTPLHACSQTVPFAIEAAGMLIDRGADINAVDNSGRTPVVTCVENIERWPDSEYEVYEESNIIAFLSLLCRCGADVMIMHDHLNVLDRFSIRLEGVVAELSKTVASLAECSRSMEFHESYVFLNRTKDYLTKQKAGWEKGISFLQKYGVEYSLEYTRRRERRTRRELNAAFELDNLQDLRLF